MKKVFYFFCLFMMSHVAVAQINQADRISTQQSFGDYTVHYNVLNSTVISPKIAETYNLVRGGDKALVNIALTKTEDGKAGLGIPAYVSGVRKNLMQQKLSLDFIEITEGNATYYLAPFVINNGEVLHFDIQVQREDDVPLEVNFSRTVYSH